MFVYLREGWHAAQFIFFFTNIQLTVRNASIQAEDIPMPYQILLDWARPQPLNMMSLIPCTASVWGNILATVTIHGLGIPSSGQMMPQSNMWGKQDPMESLIASMELLQTVERKNPKLIPARPDEEKMSYDCRGECFIRATYPGTEWVQRTMQLGRDREFEIRQTLLSMLLWPEVKTLMFTALNWPIKIVFYLHDHHQELRHDVGGNDLHREDPGDPGPL